MQTSAHAFFAKLALLALVTLAACSPAAPTPYPDEVDWDTAVEILNSGEVVAVYQLHSLDVTLELADGHTIHTVEPSIDAIFHEIDQCGDPCANIILATE